jgi:membrane protein YqaA with SNARE-associated domain
VKWLLRKITNGLTGVKDFLIPFGALGLFAIALLDSALIPLPGGPDAVMLLLSAQSPARMPFYALGATAGSVVGCVILYYISRRAGRRALEKFPEKKRARVKELVDRYDVLSVLVASVLPPPFPFKLFVITAGVFRLSLMRFIVAVAAGRAFRFLLEGFIAVRYGERAREVLAANYPAIGIGVAVLVILIFVVRGLLRRKGSSETKDEDKAVGSFPNAEARTQAEAEGSTDG